MYECPIRGVLPDENDSLICISTTSLNCSTTQVTLKQFYDSHSRSNITKLSFHWQDEPAMFFILPNHLPPKSIHLDHLLLRVFASILPFLLHTICLSSFSPSQHPSLNHFIITSFWPVRHHQLALVFFFLLLTTSAFAVCIRPTQCATYTASWPSKFHDNLETYQLMIGTDSSHAWFTATC